jgi:SP family sugar:H+ symporter-like MFS transporter
MDFWQKTFADDGREITPAQVSLIVSILSAGEFIGALLAAPFADILGRRWGLFIASGFVFNLGVVLQTVSSTQPVFVAGRFFAGLGVGIISAIVPLYQSESLPKWIRGTIVGSYQLAITIVSTWHRPHCTISLTASQGLFLASVVNNLTANRNDSGSYRIPIALQFAFSIIICVGLLFLPETPRFLVKQDKHDEAAKALSRLRRLPPTNPALLEELSEIEANHRYEMTLGKATYLDCFKGTIGKRLLTGCLLQALQQMTGVNFIFYYGTQYFQHAGFKDPFIISVVIK